MENEKNKNIGTVIILVAVGAAVLTTLGMISAPETLFSVINNASIKIILLFFIYVFLGWFGIVVYKILHLPSPRRLVLIAFRFVLFMGFILTWAPIGIASIEAFEIATDKFTLSFTAAGGISSAMFLIMVIGLIFFSYMYSQLAKYEQQNGALR